MSVKKIVLLFFRKRNPACHKALPNKTSIFVPLSFTAIMFLCLCSGVSLSIGLKATPGRCHRPTKAITCRDLCCHSSLFAHCFGRLWISNCVTCHTFLIFHQLVQLLLQFCLIRQVQLIACRKEMIVNTSQCVFHQ